MPLHVMVTLHQKRKFFIKDFFSKCDQIRKLRIWSHLLNKSLNGKLLCSVMYGFLCTNDSVERTKILFLKFLEPRNLV